MKLSNNLKVNFITPRTPGLFEVISLSIGNKTDIRISEVIRSYNISNNYLIACFDQRKLVAVVGIKCLDQKLIIRHIAILKKYQKQGIGNLLINYLKKQFNAISIVAETDEEAVGFYKKCGFDCEKFQGKYNIRYNCILNLNV